MELWFEENRRDDRQAWDVYLEKFRITYEIVKTYNEKILSRDKSDEQEDEIVIPLDNSGIDETKPNEENNDI